MNGNEINLLLDPYTHGNFILLNGVHCQTNNDIESCIKNLQKVNKIKLFAGSDLWVSYLSSLKALASLSLDACSISNKGLNALAGLQNLRQLIIDSENGPDIDFFSKLNEFAHLESLFLINCDNITNESLELISKHDQLTSLCFERGDFDDVGLKHLCKMKQLTSLRLAYCNITDHSLEYLSSLPNLQRLEIKGGKLSSRGFKQISQMHSLNHLSLNHTIDEMDKIVQLPNLRSLKLEGTCDLQDEWFIKLVEINKMECLSLGPLCTISANSLHHLERLTFLNGLSLTMFDRFSTSISKLSNLIYLNLRNCFELSDNDIEELSTLVGLIYLNLSNCEKITDLTLNLISQFKQLEVLELSNCNQLSDDGLLSLCKLQKLQYLDTKGCRRLTEKSLSFFNRQLIKERVY